MTLLFKGLTYELGSRHAFNIAGKRSWPVPANGRPGKWVKIPQSLPLKPHFSGIHCAKEDAVMSWCWERNFLVEADGETKESSECVVARRGRLLKEFTLAAGDWARLAVYAASELIAVPGEIRYPPDHIRAATDAVIIAAQKFKLFELSQRCIIERGESGHTFLQRISSEVHAQTHARALIERCENDSLSTVECGFNAQGMLMLAKAAEAVSRLQIADTQESQRNNWWIAREVCFYVRSAATQFALQSAATPALPLPSSLVEILSQEEPGLENHQPVAVALPRILLKRQSRMLLVAWGLK